jgi:hypothetical protein
MDSTEWVILAIVAGAAIVVLIALVSLWQRRRRMALRDRFGPEYDHTVGEVGSHRKAEHELRTREERFGSLDVQPLTDESRAKHTELWERAERMFVDDPELAAREADRIVRDVLDERGYPGDDLETQTAAMSVDHPKAVQRYRHGHDMIESNGKSREARTEYLRRAMIDFRLVFRELVEPEREVATH